MRKHGDGKGQHLTAGQDTPLGPLPHCRWDSEERSPSTQPVTGHAYAVCSLQSTAQDILPL